ncbi:MAG: phosphatase PAP2 family protein [Sarcina sp.]
MHFIQQMNADVLYFVQANLQFSWLNPIMKFFTDIGTDGLIWILLGIILLIFQKTRRCGFMLFFASGINLVVVEIIKHVVKEPRPWQTLPGLHMIIAPPHSYSFPSGHTAASFAAAFAIAYYLRKWAVPAFVLAILIGLSRIYLLAHYPTDVIAGVIVGTVCFYIALVIYRLGLYKVVDPILRIPQRKRKKGYYSY